MIILRKLLLLSVLCLGLLLGIGTEAIAQAPTPTPALGPIPVTDDMINAVAKTLYCPVCENIPLDVCPTQACAQWRDLIRLKLSQGATTEEIRQYFALNYGDRVLSTPPPQGLNLIVYILPPVFLIIGVTILYIVLWSKRKPKWIVPPPAEEPKTEQDPYLKRLEDELKRKD